MNRYPMFLRTRLARHQDEGATMLEYSIMVTGVAVLVVATIFVFGGAVGDLFQRAVDLL